jgi:hypothetical protein
MSEKICSVVFYTKMSFSSTFNFTKYLRYRPTLPSPFHLTYFSFQTQGAFRTLRNRDEQRQALTEYKRRISLACTVQTCIILAAYELLAPITIRRTLNVTSNGNMFQWENSVTFASAIDVQFSAEVYILLSVGRARLLLGHTNHPV